MSSVALPPVFAVYYKEIFKRHHAMEQVILIKTLHRKLAFAFWFQGELLNTFCCAKGDECDTRWIWSCIYNPLECLADKLLKMIFFKLPTADNQRVEKHLTIYMDFKVIFLVSKKNKKQSLICFLYLFFHVLIVFLFFYKAIELYFKLYINTVYKPQTLWEVNLLCNDFRLLLLNQTCC